MRMYDIIEKKRDGGELSTEEISYFVKGATSGDIPDYQITALLMAIYFNGMTDRETIELTLNMRDSGDTLDLTSFGELSVDKHSTGGVGDKTTLIVAPIVASLGAKVAKMSGRGLGFTGGTVDKLESIPNYNTSPSFNEFMSIANECGISVISQTGNLTPADKKLYSLRDVTATIESIPLITSSIMSKKLAAGAKNIVLDVKYGSGAFMKDITTAEQLALKMVEIGKRCGVNMVAILSDMDTPLGLCVGNSLEVIEAAEVLKGNLKGALYEICVKIAANMCALALKITEEEATKRVVEVIENGNAFSKMQEWIKCQGGNVSVLSDYNRFKQSKFSADILSVSEGYIEKIDALLVGKAALILGAGREKAGDSIDFSAGVKINKALGDKVESGETLFTLYTDDKERIETAKNLLLSAVSFSNTKPNRRPIIYKIIK